jgi:hypothetical protein
VVNGGLSKERKPGFFFALDLYSMGRSTETVIQHIDPKMLKGARKQYGVLRPWVEHPQEYGLADSIGVFRDCEGGVVGILGDLSGERMEYLARIEDEDEFHSSEQNARVIASEYTSNYLKI